MCSTGLFLIVEVPVVVAVSTASSHNSNITTGERTSVTTNKKLYFIFPTISSWKVFKPLYNTLVTYIVGNFES